jgi:hypothetical protein
MRFIGRIIVLALAAFIGAAAADIARQRFAGEKGRVLFRTPSGEWTVNISPQILIPAVLAGLRADKAAPLRSAGTAAMMVATGAEGPGGIARLFRRGEQ